MKKSIAILLALIMCISILAACGKEEAPPAPTPEPEAASESTPEPTPEPVEDGMTTVTITSAEFGDIVFSYPDDGSLIVEVAGPDVESLEVVDDDDLEELFDVPIYSYDLVQYQQAHIVGDGFNIIIGYTDYSDNAFGWRTFGMYSRYMRIGGDYTSLGGLEGAINLFGVVTMTFPSIDQFVGRTIMVFPDSPGAEDEDTEERNAELLERPDVKAILDSIEFPGEMKNEPRLETEPLDDKYFSINPVDGWEFIAHSLVFNSFELVKQGVGSSYFNEGEAEVNIRQFGLSSVGKEVDSLLDHNLFTDVEQLDNLTINGQEFIVLQSAGWEKFWLFTSIGAGPLDEDQDGYIAIYVHYLDDLDVAMPLINTVRIA